MKFIVTSDSHFGYKLAGENRSQSVFNTFLEILRYAKKSNISTIIHLGDMFETSRPTSSDRYKAKRVLERIEEAGIVFRGIAGNHDTTSAGVNNALEYIDESEYIRLYGKAFHMTNMEGGVPALFIPFGTASSPAELIDQWEDSIREYGNLYIFSHYDLIGAKMPSGFEIASGIMLPPEELVCHRLREYFTWFNGHYHVPQQVKVGDHTIYIPGSMDCLNFNSGVTIPREFFVVDAPTGEITKVDNPNAAHFVEWTVNVKDWGLGDLPDILMELSGDKQSREDTSRIDVLKISVTALYSEMGNSKAVEAHCRADWESQYPGKLLPFNFIWVRDQIQTSMVVSDIEDKSEIINKYLDISIPTELKSKRKEIKDRMESYL